MTLEGSGAAGALCELRVLDLSTLYAAPQISALLADFGADVVKVEPPDGDPLAGLGVRRGGRSFPYALANRGKHRVVLDADDPTGAATLRELTAGADVVVANQPSAVLERWGCTPDEVLARNPWAVIVTMSCYGWSGSMGGAPGNGTLAEAFGGLTHLTGEPDGPPVLPSVALGDALTGLAGALTVLVACWHRDAAGGPGQHVDLSMFEPVLHVVGSAVVAWTPGSEPPARTGSRVVGAAPRNVYLTADRRFVVVSGTTDGQVARVLALLDVPEDERSGFALAEDRLRRADELDQMVATWIESRPRDEVLAALAEARVPAAPVHDLAELLGHPHATARGSLTTVDDPLAGPTVLPGPLAHLSVTPADLEPPPVHPMPVDEVRDRWSVVTSHGPARSGPAQPNRPALS